MAKVTRTAGIAMLVGWLFFFWTLFYFLIRHWL
jgi:hypothetical protein